MADINELIEKLAELDEETLQAQLGMQLQSLEDDLTTSASVESININTLTAVPRGLEGNKFIEFGQNFFKRLNGEAYDFLCDRDPFGDGCKTMQKIEDAYNESSTKAAGMLTPILVTNLGLAPAIAAIVATLIVQKIASAAGETICSMWQDSFDGSKPPEIE
ncbi:MULTISPECIES: hypothetical protein [Okeania]|uniref:Uncharacterized protein n=1 Tax=Okeania hirsuta TaxID=1458930 RepID=A0A3N6PED6_9CYAN|nr:MULTISPECIES: hypothetical protein [Okeania]NES74627.1 hypothetical protein [Okeania sp. SIO1H4]NES88688.1 hypothetical protein [Okeania sp. SIO2B9]NET18701.1 hypothetical protein [Okeania sp. SIO1H5]NET74799.1 hypothetical protein [Okeania sp. SIO1F9]NET92348.1 hypothetical protein [Okeania sp. SIO1H2]